MSPFLQGEMLRSNRGVLIVFAAPSVTINSVPDVITAGTTFPISFTVNEASSSASYYYKFFGGVDTDVYKIINNSDLSYSSNWVNFPQITLDSNSSNIFNGYAFIKPEVNTGILNLKIRVALITDPTNTKLGATSPSFSIDVAAAPPPTETPVPTPTSVPSPTPTKAPTPTKTLTPTKIPTPSLTTIPIISSTISVSIDAPISTSTPTSESESVLGTTTTTKKSFLPLALICLGGLLLLTPLIIAKIKHGN